MLNFEQRRKPRVRVSFQAIINITIGKGHKIETEGVVDNLSACGLYLLTNHFLFLGNKVSVVIPLGDYIDNAEVIKTYLKIDGNVVRVDRPNDDQYGIAVEIQHYRFL